MGWLPEPIEPHSHNWAFWALFTPDVAARNDLVPACSVLEIKYINRIHKLGEGVQLLFSCPKAGLVIQVLIEPSLVWQGWGCLAQGSLAACWAVCSTASAQFCCLLGHSGRKAQNPFFMHSEGKDLMPRTGLSKTWLQFWS